MNPVALLAVLGIGWLVRRSVAVGVERSSSRLLRRGPDGIIIGAGAIDRRGAARKAILILHGFGDTPQTVRYLAEHLHGLGFTVRAPLLAGHGRTLREFGRSSADAWLDSAARALAELRREHDAVGVVGLSMGGALAVILASTERASAPASDDFLSPDGRDTTGRDDPATGSAGDAPDALVLIAPYLSMRARARRLAAMHWAVSPFVRYLPSREAASIQDVLERKHNRGFGTVTPRVLMQLQRLVSRARRALPDVEAPSLMIQSREDNRIEVRAAEASFERLGATEKRLEWADGGHVLTVDIGRERVLALTGEWLLAHVGRSTPSAPPVHP